MTTFKIAKTAFAVGILKSNLLFLALCSLIFLMAYRGGSTRSEAKEQTPSPPTAGGSFLNNRLYTLYIENRAGSEQLKRLLGENAKQKLVLQLFRGEEGYLQLMAFPSTNGNGRYFLDNSVELLRSDVFSTTMPEGENIFFGDLQVANRPSQQKSTIRDLKAHLYDAGKPEQNAGWEYIWFVPKIIEVNEETFRRKYIVYGLERSDEAPQVSSQKAFFRSIPLDDDANPSPPRRLE